ncbi:hypothetical protein DPMN_140960 [Dreissena polymorpha]|uniref:Uncharacterized protein n=1 Tax=Dreissena polymorpha TaxID=45954 RepID=A0A9D4JHV2_DREPO|nr:hypothetical protein DPMN_140960 [Dreissena polymorpha]
MTQEQYAMRRDINDLMILMTATNQHLSELVSFNQRLTSVQERLSNMDSHVKEVEIEKVGRRTHLLRRGLEQEKAATLSRLNYVQQIQEDVQSDINVLMSATDNFRILEKEMADSVVQIETLEKTLSDINVAANKTQSQISTVEWKVAATQSNTHTLQSRVQSLECTQVDLNSKTMAIESQVETTGLQIVGRIETLEKTQSDVKGTANKTQARIATVKQELAATQITTNFLQSLVQSQERTQTDLESRVDTTRIQKTAPTNLR